MQYRILMFMSRMICCLPHSFLMSLGKGLGILYYKFIKKQRQLALRQIRRSLDISEAEAERTADGPVSFPLAVIVSRSHRLERKPRHFSEEEKTRQ